MVWGIPLISLKRYESIFTKESPMTNNNDAEINQNLTEEQKSHFLYNHLSIETEEKSKTIAKLTRFHMLRFFIPGIWDWFLLLF